MRVRLHQFINTINIFVSIHAPVRVRRVKSSLSGFGSGFNSRTREGATCIDSKEKLNLYVSIHAPVRVRHSTINVPLQ